MCVQAMCGCVQVFVGVQVCVQMFMCVQVFVCRCVQVKPVGACTGGVWVCMCVYK